MELKHSFTVPTSIDDAWALFMDLGAVGGCFPGATVTEVTDAGFSGTVKVKLGPIALQYAGSGSFIERDDTAHRAVIEAKGKDKRGNGTAGATVTIQLAPDGAGTRAEVDTDLAVTGKPAQFGRGVMQDVSDKLLGQFVACIERQFEQPAPATEAAAQAPAEVPAEAPAGASGAPAAAAAPGAKKAPARKAAAKKAAAKKAAPAAKAAAAPAEATAAPAEATEATEATEAPAAATTAAAGAAAGAPPLEQIGDTEVDEGAITVTGGRPETPAAQPAPVAAARPAYSRVDMGDDDAIDLGATIMPVLIRRYGSYAAAGLVGFFIGWLLGRRRRSRG